MQPICFRCFIQFHLYGQVERLYLLLGIFPRVHLVPPVCYLVFVPCLCRGMSPTCICYSIHMLRGLKKCFRKGVRQSAKRVLCKNNTRKVHISLSGSHAVYAHPWCLSAVFVLLCAPVCRTDALRKPQTISQGSHLRHDLPCCCRKLCFRRCGRLKTTETLHLKNQRTGGRGTFNYLVSFLS